MAEWRSDRAAGWYGDPYGRHSGRYWDGSAWTEQVRDSSGNSIDIPGRNRQRLVVASRTPAGTSYRLQGGPGTTVWTALLAGLLVMEIIGIGQFVSAIGAHGRFRTADLFAGCWLCGFPLLLARLPIRFLRHPPGVIVSPDGITANNLASPIRRARAADVAGIVLRNGTVGRSALLRSIPYLELVDGTSFRLDAITARVGEQAELQSQRQVVSEILDTLGVANSHDPSTA